MLLRQKAHIVFLLTILLQLSGSFSQAAGPLIEEYQIKAALLYNLAKYVDWPAHTFARESSPMTICTIGQSDLTNGISSLQNKQINGHPVAVRHVSGATDSRGCNILVIGNIDHGMLQSVLDKTSHNGLLTISDHDRFAQSGGTVGFYHQDNKIRFEINLAAAHKQKLKISSQLLKLARIIQGDEQ